MDILESITEHETTFEHIGEECGVVGIAASKRENVAALAYYALYALQHRGQQSAGIAVNDDGVINAHCDEGLVNEVFDGIRLQNSEREAWRSGMSAIPQPATKSASTASPLW